MTHANRRRRRGRAQATGPWADRSHRCDNHLMAMADLLLGRPPHTPQATAVHSLDDGVTIYWRDGCPFCLRLRWTVRKHAARATWVDIWSDPEAAAFVRTTNESGNEVVPTVVIDGTPHTNPDPRAIADRLACSSTT